MVFTFTGFFKAVAIILPIGKMMATALKNPVNVKTIIFLVAVYLTWNLAAGTNGQFMPYLYAAAGNIDATGQSLLGVVQWVLVAVCSLAIFSRFGDIVSHRVLFGASALLPSSCRRIASRWRKRSFRPSRRIPAADAEGSRR